MPVKTKTGDKPPQGILRYMARLLLFFLRLDLPVNNELLADHHRSSSLVFANAG